METQERRREDVQGQVHSMETFGLVDGPGVRFVVFLQGCQMCCRYCHNPETWPAEGGTMCGAWKLFEHIYRYRSYWKKKGQPNGGITVSGGDPLLQPEFVAELFAFAKEKGVHTAIDTSGNPFSLNSPYIERFEKLMETTDLVLLDLKEIDEEKHRALTGCSNENVLALARWLSDHGKEMWIRHVLVPGLTDDEQGLLGLREFIRSLKTVSRVEILPYHTLGMFKWKNMGITYPLEGTPVPAKEEIERAERLIGAGVFR